MLEGGEPDAFRDTFVAMAGARAIITATRLGIVAALAAEPAAAGALARRLGLAPAGVEALLSALAALGYLEVDAEGGYRPTAAGSQLDAGARESVANFVGEYNADAWEMLGRLDEVLHDPGAAASHRRGVEDPFWEHYIRGLFELSRQEREEWAQLVPVWCAERTRVLRLERHAQLQRPRAARLAGAGRLQRHRGAPRRARPVAAALPRSGVEAQSAIASVSLPGRSGNARTRPRRSLGRWGSSGDRRPLEVRARAGAAFRRRRSRVGAIQRSAVACGLA